MAGPCVAFVSFRLGLADGVSREAEKWAWAFGRLGFSVVTVAGDGPVDHLLPGLAIGAAEPPARQELVDVLAGADLVVVENLLSLPLNPDAAAVVADVLRGRPAVLHHYDLPWQRRRFAGHPPPPTDEAWAHVTINHRSRRELRAHGIEATTLYNRFRLDPEGDSAAARAWADAGERLLVLQPTRAIARKGVPAALALAEHLDAVFWLTGPAEEGYGAELETLLDGACVPVRRGLGPLTVDDAYAGCDLVAFPSTWEGFGNPIAEAATHRRPVAAADYPIAAELAALGLRWLPAADPAAVAAWLRAPDAALLDGNEHAVRTHLDLGDLPTELEQRLAEAGWGL